MSEEIFIRKAKKEDFSQIQNLIVQVHKLHVKSRSDIYKDIDPIDMDTFEEELGEDTNIYLVAETKNKIVGICFAKIREIANNKIMKARKILHIEDICVDENIRRREIGKKLYDEIVKLAEEHKVQSIELMVWGFNKNAINFYKNLGMGIKNLRFEQKIN